MTKHLDNGELGGSDIKSINISGQTGEGLLGSIRADKGVDLDGVNIVELLQSLLDLTLVGTDIEAWLMGNRLAWVFRSSRELEGLRLVEGGRETDLADLVGVDLNRISALI